MKKMFLILCGSLVAIAVVATTVVGSRQEYATVSELLKTDVEALGRNENGGGGCKWKILDCKGIGTGNYEACLETGDGNSCSCGATTRNCV
jgi:hypothetical protein